MLRKPAAEASGLELSRPSAWHSMHESCIGCHCTCSQAVLNGQDCLLVMATGGGKSLTYQVPPLVSGKVRVCWRNTQAQAACLHRVLSVDICHNH